MRDSRFRFWIVAAIAVSTLAMVNADGQQDIATTPTCWEYKIFPLVGDSLAKQEAAFNSMGNDGWEYVGHQPHRTQVSGYAIFKRPQKMSQCTTLLGNYPTDEPVDTLTARINEMVVELLRNTPPLSHGFDGPQVETMSKQLATMAFPAIDGSVARTLGISDPTFFVYRRECGFSLLPEFPSMRRTYEACRLNKDYELIVVRETSYYSSGIELSREQSARIQRVEDSN